MPAPRRHGLTLESGIGFVSQLGSLKNVTPTAPLFQLRIGYELFEVLMPFVEADVAFMRTSYANEPPPPRTFFQFGGEPACAGLPVGPFGDLCAREPRVREDLEQNCSRFYAFRTPPIQPLLRRRTRVRVVPGEPHLALGNSTRGGPPLRRRPDARPGWRPPLAHVGSLQLRYAF